MSKTITACQSNYIPWKGYFDLIAAGDEFVLYDEVQYTKNDWRNRNRIKTQHGPLWLTIPIASSGRFHQRVSEAEISDSRWARKHWRSIEVSYAGAAHFGEFRDFLEELYLGPETARLRRLSEINERFLRAACDVLGITTPLTRMADLELREDDRVDRLLEMCAVTGATRYVTGPAAANYLSRRPFEEAGVELAYIDYSGYPEYHQIHPPFIHGVSVIDLILNTGTDAGRYLTGGRLRAHD